MRDGARNVGLRASRMCAGEPARPRSFIVRVARIMRVSVQPQERQDGKHNHDETNYIYEIIHVESSVPRVDALAIRETEAEQWVCHGCLLRLTVWNLLICADSCDGRRGIAALLGRLATWEMSRARLGSEWCARGTRQSERGCPVRSASAPCPAPVSWHGADQNCAGRIPKRGIALRGLTA
jgi:hypothetical protein